MNTCRCLRRQGLPNRQDLRAAQLSIATANSNHELAKANGKQDVTVSGNYSHVNGAAPLPC
jgi:outer membrane protein TolC